MRRYTPAPLTPPIIHVGEIPKGYRGTKKTVQHIQALIQAGAKDFYVRQKAIDILLAMRIKPKDYLGEIQALFEWVQGHVRYTKDPFRVEVLHTARRMLELSAGDCDDLTILLGAMLESIGHPVRVVLSGPDPLQPRLFTHVYLEVYDQGRWIPLDATMPYPMGWAPQVIVKKVIAIERRPKMMSENDALQGPAAPAAPDWLRGFIQSLRGKAISPRDARVKSLWDLLRQRQLLRRSAWLQSVLRRLWERGLPARPRPYTTRRLVRLLRRWGVLPALPGRRAARPLRPVRLQPVPRAKVRPVRLAETREP